MFACLIMGDSIAVGTAEAVNAGIQTHCTVVAAIGASTHQVQRWRPPPGNYNTCLFSLGSNDRAGPALRSKLMAVRRQVCSRRVIWILPYNRSSSAAVTSIAVSFQDEVLDLAQFATRDGVHPISYGAVAAALLGRR